MSSSRTRFLDRYSLPEYRRALARRYDACKASEEDARSMGRGLIPVPYFELAVGTVIFEAPKKFNDHEWRLVVCQRRPLYLRWEALGSTTFDPIKSENVWREMSAVPDDISRRIRARNELNGAKPN